MSNEINLLPGKTKRTSTLLKKRQRLHMIAMTSLFIISFFSISLFILIALSPLPSLREREKDETKRLSFFNEMIVKISLTKDRITKVKQILQNRLVYSESIESIRKQLPPTVNMEEVLLDEKVILVTFTSSSLSPLDQLLQDIIKTNTSAQLFDKVEIVSLKQDFEKGSYFLTLELL